MGMTFIYWLIKDKVKKKYIFKSSTERKKNKHIKIRFNIIKQLYKTMQLLHKYDRNSRVINYYNIQP